MVNVIENRAEVRLIPLDPPGPGPGEGWMICRVRVEASTDVEGYPNLLASGLPRECQALMREGAWAELGDQDQWQVEASLVAPGRLRVERTLG